MIIKDLGAVTAYAAAVEGGYTGTEEEFATLMASYASVAEEAAESAESASQSAESASASAQTATTKAGEASTSATQAGASATSASQSAQTATTKASEASASASTASTKASEASTSATTASTKASEASASATSAQTAQGLAESARDDAIDAKTDAESARDLAQQYAESIDPENIYSAYPTDTASGSVVSFADGADDIPMKSVVVNIEPVQSGSGDPSPDNVRPISGWTGAQVVRTGKNLFDSATVFASFGFTHEDDGSWSRENIYGIANTQLWENPGFVSQISIRFTAKYASDTNTGIRFKFKYTDGTFGNLYLTPSLTYQNYTFTSNSGKVVSAIFFDYGSNNTKTWFKDVQFEASSTATAYEPYTGATYPITFPTEAGTVYGGELDVTNGVLTVDRAMVTLDENGSYYINTYTDRNRIVCNMYDNVGKANAMFVSDSLKSMPPSSGGNGQSDWEIWCSNGAPRMWISVPSTIATVADFKNYLSTNPITVVYELAEPTTYTLTPTEIKSLLGDNNIWADAGDTEVTYRADTAMYIDKKIAEVINALS